MESYSDIFKTIQNEVKHKILYEIYYLGNFKNDDSKTSLKMDMLYRRLDFLEETTVKYILANAKACLYGYRESAEFLESHGVKPVRFNENYDLRYLENYLNDVFVKLNCPGILPSVDDINSDVSFFGFTSDTDSKKFSSLYSALINCNSPMFYDMYQIGLDKGLSNDEIFSYFSKIFKVLDYYNYSLSSSDILSFVPYLDIEVDEYFKSVGENFSMSKK